MLGNITKSAAAFKSASKGAIDASVKAGSGAAAKVTQSIKDKKKVKDKSEAGQVLLDEDAELRLCDGSAPSSEETALALQSDAAIYQEARDKVFADVTGSGDQPGPAPGGSPVETELYEVLGVAPDATQGQIKKAYYKLARDCHPDKNPDDDDAAAKFQRIGEAYQVLSDAEIRAKYDKHGKASLEQGFMDSATMFSMIFGSAQFEHLFGRTAMAATAEKDMTAEELAAFQQDRETTLAAELSQRLERWNEVEAEAFCEDVIAETIGLRETSFGVPLLHTIGYIYEQQAKQEVGLLQPLGIGGRFSQLREMGHNVKARNRAGVAAARVQGLAEQGGKDEETASALLEYMWYITVLDIESTLRAVIRSVLRADGISKEDVRLRAKGIMLMGKVYQKA